LFFYLKHKRAFKTPYFSAAILFVFLSIYKFKHRSICVILLPQFALRSYLFAKWDNFQNSKFLFLDLLCFPIYWQYKIAFTARYFSFSILFLFFFLLQRKKAFKTRYFCTSILIVFSCICKLRHRFKCAISLPQFTLRSHLFAK